ncbi:transient receptor potential cation channel subfamily v member 6 [Lasius niger]|uniref:Transient receptor potential cation channel subfamily v member 6 n=1 Tax=Lasius niger TaxID=67767 RepID=A0A0J7L7G3_LASNI|nr:transient receptor potential cation channel subfamily v member 6 [Lasius niger]
MTQPKAIPNDHQVKTTQNNPETMTSQPHKQPLVEQTKLSGLTDLIDKSDPVRDVEAMNLKNTNQTKALEAAIEDPFLELAIVSETTTDYEILLQIAKSALVASETSIKTTIDPQILAHFAMIAPPTTEKSIVKKQYFMESSDNDLGVY